MKLSSDSRTACARLGSQVDRPLASSFRKTADSDAMARTALSLIPSPDPDTFTELLVNDLHVPLDSTASMRRWLPGHLWTLAHEWLNAME